MTLDASDEGNAFVWLVFGQVADCSTTYPYGQHLVVPLGVGCSEQGIVSYLFRKKGLMFGSHFASPTQIDFR